MTSASFPVSQVPNPLASEMTLRDKFAMQALPMQVSFSGDRGHAEALARIAYMYADAMLKARQG